MHPRSDGGEGWRKAHQGGGIVFSGVRGSVSLNKEAKEHLPDILAFEQRPERVFYGEERNTDPK